VKQLTILGATGSIGQSTLSVVAEHPEAYRVYAVTANTQVERMLEICQQHHPRVAVMSDRKSADQLAALMRDASLDIEVLAGEQGLSEVAAAAEVDIVMAAIVGSVGLMPTLSAVRGGKRVLLANKESLVMAGHLFMREVATHGAELLPIDSEHNAIFQCLPAGYPVGLESCGVRKILLTGSGGPFRETPLDQFESITPAEAIAHPNWSMGPKISVDSATMMNKGLELIEACWLFGVDHSQVDIVLHPQSIVHSMVAYNDGSVLAQMGNPDMRTPIANALAWPQRIDSGVEPLDLILVGQLDFAKADDKRFPCLRLARQAIQQGGTSMAILNAANEVAVEAFLAGRIGFTRIPQLIEMTMNCVSSSDPDDLQQILQDDRAARACVEVELTRQG
jgi:1-deoxy-D-xylulose-5-phosphate reductoisomerase